MLGKIFGTKPEEPAPAAATAQAEQESLSTLRQGGQSVEAAAGSAKETAAQAKDTAVAQAEAAREYAAEKAEEALEKVHEAQASAVQRMRVTGTNIAEGVDTVIHKASETLESAREKVNPK